MFNWEGGPISRISTRRGSIISSSYTYDGLSYSWSIICVGFYIHNFPVLDKPVHEDSPQTWHSYTDVAINARERHTNNVLLDSHMEVSQLPFVSPQHKPNLMQPVPVCRRMIFDRIIYAKMAQNLCTRAMHNICYITIISNDKAQLACSHLLIATIKAWIRFNTFCDHSHVRDSLR